MFTRKKLRPLTEIQEIVARNRIYRYMRENGIGTFNKIFGREKVDFYNVK